MVWGLVWGLVFEMVQGMVWGKVLEMVQLLVQDWFGGVFWGLNQGIV